MFFEFLRLLGLSGESPLTVEFFPKLLLIMFSGLILVFGGYMIKGVWGAVIALIIGTLVYLYVKGLPPF